MRHLHERPATDNATLDQRFGLRRIVESGN
jgi:hypothetical protein